MSESPVFNADPRPSMTCKRCGRVFEVPFSIGDVKLAGHPVGHPVLCVPLPTLGYGSLDARKRKAERPW